MDYYLAFSFFRCDRFAPLYSTSFSEGNHGLHSPCRMAFFTFPQRRNDPSILYYNLYLDLHTYWNNISNANLTFVQVTCFQHLISVHMSVIISYPLDWHCGAPILVSHWSSYDTQYLLSPCHYHYFSGQIIIFFCLIVLLYLSPRTEHVPSSRVSTKGHNKATPALRMLI